ncbi:hypothetical protein [Paractinoplanes durhamensis]|uniref:hypothetical protein n=1 Tax=Paractinoplanes durhamensis TaxID=113563 RepID=UPI0031DA12D6
MSNDDDFPFPDDGVNDQPVAGDGRSRRHRTRIAVGVIGLGAVLSAGAYIATDKVIDHRNASVATEAGAPPPQGAADSVTVPSVAGAPAPTASPTKGAAKPPATTSTSVPASVAEEIRKAREKAAKDGHPVQPALTPSGDLKGKVTTRNERRPNGSLRVVTARFDLTGQREMLWAADKGKPVGAAHCTSKIHFSNAAEPVVQPNLLLCWQTSAAKSVVTVLVDQGGHPSAEESVKVINSEWAKLG